MSFGDRLKDARLKNGITQQQLANAIGVAKSTLTGYEKGNREPDVQKIKKLSSALGVDANYLIGVNLSEKNDSNQKTTPPGPVGEEEYADEDFETAFKLYNAFLNAGLIEEGQDLTDRQVDFLDGLCSIIRAFFGGSNQ